MHWEGSCKLNVKNKLRNQPTLIEVKDFSFDYDHNQEKTLLEDINITIGTHETILLVGPSGSGKSTLALCLNGLYPDAVEGWQSGAVYFKGKNVNKYEKGEINQDIGVVFQDPDSQFCMITVEDELAFTMENIQIPRGDMKEKMIQALREVGLENELYRPIHELSGGQKQRVALASVLLLEPSLLILDEPTANLDPAARINFIKLIKRLKASRHLSIVIIEHQLDDWLALTDRVIALNKHGKIIADSSPQDVFYGKYTILRDEGVHLPKVVNDVMNFTDKSIVKKENLPLTLAEMANFSYKNNLQKFLHVKTKPKKMNTKSDIILSCKGINFSRKQEVILKNIDLNIHQGEFIGILGENGAGKSTLLHLLAGILSPDSGKRTFLAKDYESWNESDLRKNMGFVFQNPEHQFITNTVYDELTFGMKLNGKTTKEIRNKVDELLDIFGLESHRWSNPFSLSGGQKRRLSVATMLDETPKLLLFDEPTFGQDAKTTKELMGMIKQLRKNGTAIIFVTHDMDLVDQYCERVIVLEEGEICFEGTPQVLWNDRVTLENAHLQLPYHVQLQDQIAAVKEKCKDVHEGEHKYVKVY